MGKLSATALKPTVLIFEKTARSKEGTKSYFPPKDAINFYEVTVQGPKK